MQAAISQLRPHRTQVLGLHTLAPKRSIHRPPCSPSRRARNLIPICM